MDIKKLIKKPEFWICALGLVGLAALFIYWYFQNRHVTLPGFLAALLSAALFAALCIRFVPVWMDFWRDRRKFKDRKLISQPGYMTAKIFLSFLGFDAAVVLLVYLLRCAAGYGGSFMEVLEFWRCTDSNHYLDIARDWYLSQGEWDRLVQLVFLPGYPIAVRLLRIIFRNYLVSGMIVSALSFAGAGCVFYKLLRLDMGHESALRGLKFLCLIPGSFFFAAPMSESLFLLLSLLCVYSVRRGKWRRGAIFGGFAAFTRSLGLILLVPVLMELISRAIAEKGGFKKWAAPFLSSAIIPLGFGGYILINYFVSGDPFKFMEYQSVHWGQHLGFFFNTAAYQTECAISTFSENYKNFLGLWLPNLLFAFLSLILMLLAAKKLRPTYTAWFIAYFAVAIGSTWLLSGPRYLMVLTPVHIAITRLTKKRAANICLTAACGILDLLYLLAFVLRWQVW